MVFKDFLKGFGIIAIIISLLPLLPVDFWWIRMFDFPHIQLTAITFTAIIAYFLEFDKKDRKDYFFTVLLTVCFIYQFSKLAPYTFFYEKEVNNATLTDTKNRVKLLTANVLQKNEQDKELIKIIKDLNPDILIFTEANQRWQNAITSNISTEYKYKVEMPLENTYGILMYSKFELIEPQVKFMVTDTIPSIHTKFKMSSGEVAQLYAVHPTPPMPQENPLSTDRDAELMLTVELARKSILPVIVIGDFNDVAWSPITELFQRTSELLDIRVGRGLYNTFNADSYFLRWPLDHIYVSPEFRVADILNCDNINSDHFPYYTELYFEPKGAKEQLPEPASKEDLKEAKREIKKLKNKQ